MMDAPSADIHVDAELAAGLVAAQHPDLVGPVAVAANGWDCVMFRLGDDLAVRLPRRSVAAGLVLHEQRWLPELAALSPVPVPAPVRVGLPTREFPFAWSIVPWFDGVAAHVLEPASRAAAAPGLAVFVAALGTGAPADAPLNPHRGVPLAARDNVMRARLASGRLPDARALTAVWERSLAAPVWTGAPVWVHGDLHPANLVLAASGVLAAVIDFGDVCAGDPACDLATAWLTFDAAGRTAFRAELEGMQGTNAATWDRARGWALVIGSAIADSVETSSPLGRVGTHTLAQVLLD
ncbi:aminoglycoside phosphotransferase family protein [Aeromicrobium sp.]|uniref:aminoglycoside phosphotransferase family protein n=1 Tax=Aeromicrobium sp. TaxID=1871063 RepID=UPI002FCA69ED